MKQDTNKTDVLFLIECESMNKQIFAYFPKEQTNDFILRGVKHINYQSYAHIGQHSPCSPAYANACKKATPDQYKDLKEELESIGYNLNVLN